MGLGGVKAKAWCEQKYETRPSPEPCHLQPQNMFEHNPRAFFISQFLDFQAKLTT